MAGFTGADDASARNTLFPPDDPAQIWPSNNQVGTETLRSMGMPQPTAYGQSLTSATPLQNEIAPGTMPTIGQMAAEPVSRYVDPWSGQMTQEGQQHARNAIDMVMAMGGVGPSGGGVRAYHGTRGAQPITKFSQEAAQNTGRWTNDEGAGIGFHFSEDPEVAAGYGKVSPYDINMKKPLHISESDVQSAQEDWLGRLENSGENDSLVDYIRETKAFDNPGSGYYNYGLKLLGDEARANGHDGMVFRRQSDFVNDKMVNEHIVFDPSAISPAQTAQ